VPCESSSDSLSTSSAASEKSLHSSMTISMPIERWVVSILPPLARPLESPRVGILCFSGQPPYESRVLDRARNNVRYLLHDGEVAPIIVIQNSSRTYGPWFSVAPCPNSISFVPPVFFRRILALKISPSQKLRKILHRLHLKSAQLGSTTTSIVGLPKNQIPSTLLSVL
jgi:hypothetical protein